MNKDLINRLRDCHATTHTRSLIDEAADALERLTSGDVELPEPNVEIISGHREPFTFYDAGQLREYGDRRAAAERERCADVCRDLADRGFDVTFEGADSGAYACEEVIRAGGGVL